MVMTKWVVCRQRGVETKAVKLTQGDRRVLFGTLKLCVLNLGKESKQGHKDKD